MPTYKVTDPATGRTLSLTGDSPPTEEELESIFQSRKEDVEYSSIRSGLVDFVESGLAVGDELDAAIRVLTGEAEDYSSGIEQSRAELEAFERDNPYASGFITAAGVGAGLFVPGAGLVRVAQTGSKLQRAVKVGALGSAEGAAYGFLSGEDEGRLESAKVGAVAGGLLGGGASLLTKNADEIAAAVAKMKAQRQGSGSFIGGEEGFATVGRAGQTLGRKSDTSAQKRKASEVVEDAEILEDLSGESTFVGDILLGTREWMVKNVGERPARLAEDSEIMVRHELNDIAVKFDENFADAFDILEKNKTLKTALSNMNKSISKNKRFSWDQVNRVAKTPQEKLAVAQLESQVKRLQKDDFLDFTNLVDYMPAKAIRRVGKRAGADDYANPVEALKELAQDIAGARAVAARFNIDLSKIKTPKNMRGKSRMDLVINEIGKQAKKQGASKEVAANLTDGLKTILISAKLGGNAVGAVSRRAASTALLANPGNAILNIPEGITSPIFQNGFAAWAKTLPRAILATFDSDFGKIDPNWLSNKTLGLDKNYMGEIANKAVDEGTAAADTLSFIKLPSKIGKLVDYVGEKAYKYSGVQTVNRMSQEILSNSAIQRGRDLAKAGDAKSLEKLRKHDGMRGLSRSEFESTVEALKKGDVSNPWIINFAGASLNKWQPVSASTMPKAYNDNPNARMMYSMLSYMNRQMNNIRTEVGLNIQKTQKLGINSEEGAEAARKAMVQTGKYIALFGVFTGIWDDARKTLDFSNEKYIEDVLTPEGISSATMNQLASNVTSGVVNIRAKEYGGQTVSVSPPPLTALARAGSGLLTSGQRVYEGEPDPLDPLLKLGQTYVPGVANIDRVLRMTPPEVKEQLGIERERLLTDN